MILIYVKKQTPRISYTFKHVCMRILGLEIAFTSTLEKFLSHQGPKISYGKKPLGGELFYYSEGLLEQQGIESIEVVVRPWDEIVGIFPAPHGSALPFDVFSASFYLLSRYEEYLPHVKDEKGRFMASESLAYREGFLQQPVIDIWAYRFKDSLLSVFPELILELHKREMTIHTLIEGAQPYAYAQKGFFRTTIGYLSDLIKGNFRSFVERTKVVLGFKRDPLNTFKWIVNTAKHSNFKITVFFMLGDAMTFEESMNYHRKRLKLLIKYVADYKEVGLIFSFKSLSDLGALKKEKNHIEGITHRDLRSSMNAEVLVNLPDIYRQLVELEVQKDFTMGYYDTPGFRAGTCTPFLFYDLDFEIKTPLLIHPVVARTSMFDSKYSNNKERMVDQLLQSVAGVHGYFAMVFSNKDFTGEDQNQVWRAIFSEKLGNFTGVKN